MTDFNTGCLTARTDIPSPVPFIPGLKALAAWIEAAIEGDRT
ncbi:hypothetical protein SAMN04488030_1564 [Aliiroseovarius halocynthiae]|nr:hypothetical protein [Aliiroseovarius halocynthiae]SMR72820.1 hypothetical protein SAMN04488030_1564 [Aliiroseovarius halocynthiae]